MMTMPFGKYKGQTVDELPPDYCRWLLGNIDLREPLRSAIEQQVSGTSVVAIWPNLNAMRRRFAAKYHPDRPSGSQVAMTVVNEIFDSLEAAK